MVLVTEAFRRRHFPDDEEALGGTVMVDDRPHTIVGVLPASFRTIEELRPGGNATADLGVALVVPGGRGALFSRSFANSDRTFSGHTLIARLRPQVPLDRARAEVAAVLERLPQQSRVSIVRLGVTLVPVTSAVRRGLAEPMTLLVVAVGLLLVVACGNTAGLLLVRGEHRRRELAVRAALGASVSRLVRSVLAETVLLAIAGGAVGVLFAWGGLAAVRWAAGDLLTRIGELALNLPLLGFATGASLLCGLLAGLVPALRVGRRNVNSSLTHMPAAGTGTRRPLTSRLVLGEVALSVITVVVGSLLTNDMIRASSIDRGMDPAGVLSAEIALSRSRYRGDRAQAFFDDLLQHASAIPGVRSAALVNAPPGGQVATVTHVRPEGWNSELVSIREVSPQYFSVLSIHVTAGRPFSDRDAGEGSKVVIVNEAFARRYWGEPAQAIGKWVVPTGQNLPADGLEAARHTVIGVVTSTREYGALQAEQPETYWLSPWLRGSSDPATQRTLLLRADQGNASHLAPALTTVVKQLDPQQPLYQVRTLERLWFSHLARQRLVVGIMLVFAGLTLLLAAVGVYGLVSYVAATRRHDIAIRLALGCTPRRVLGAMLRSSLVLASCGSAVGLPLALGWMWFASSQLITVSGTNPSTCVAAVGFVTWVAVTASLVPAWRASRVDPAVALRRD